MYINGQRYNKKKTRWAKWSYTRVSRQSANKPQLKLISAQNFLRYADRATSSHDHTVHTCPGKREHETLSGISILTQRPLLLIDFIGPSRRHERALRWPSPSHNTWPVYTAGSCVCVCVWARVKESKRTREWKREKIFMFWTKSVKISADVNLHTRVLSPSTE